MQKLGPDVSVVKSNLSALKIQHWVSYVYMYFTPERLYKLQNRPISTRTAYECFVGSFATLTLRMGQCEHFLYLS